MNVSDKVALSTVSADDRLWASISDGVCMADAYQLYCTLRVLGVRMMASACATIVVTRLRWWKAVNILWRPSTWMLRCVVIIH